jgi:hypothetical protein
MYVIKMPDWGKIKSEKQKSISLCEARNGAILLLRDVKSDNWDSLYKETVRNLFRLNQELDQELLNNKTEIAELSKNVR